MFAHIHGYVFGRRSLEEVLVEEVWKKFWKKKFGRSFGRRSLEEVVVEEACTTIGRKLGRSLGRSLEEVFELPKPLVFCRVWAAQKLLPNFFTKLLHTPLLHTSSPSFYHTSPTTGGAGGLGAGGWVFLGPMGLWCP